MDNNSLTEQSSNDINNSNIERACMVEQSQRKFVPKIRIRLRPQLVQSSLDSEDFISKTMNKICDKVTLIQPNDDIINWNTEKRCYKIQEDSGGGGKNEDTQFNKHFMIHGINLRSRPQALKNKWEKLKNDNDKKKQKLLTQKKNKEFIKKSKLKPISNKRVFQSLLLNTSKETDKIEKNVVTNKLSRKKLNKIRNEAIMSNINLKEIINHENFLKFPPEIQWQLVNLLPNCDKPKISSESDSCKCTDSVYNSNENCQIAPNLGFSVLNNEFLGKALTKFSLKMGQCDLINILNSERENLRSRPLTLLNEDILVKTNIDNELEVNKDQNINKIEDDNIKVLEEVKSNSSNTTTDTVEMNGIGNIEEKNLVESTDRINFDQCESIQSIIVKEEMKEQIDNTHSNEIELSENQIMENISNSIENFIKEDTDIKKSNDRADLNQAVPLDIEENLVPTVNNLPVEVNDNRLSNPDTFEETRRKRGRKRKLFSSSNDLQIIPIKRSNRSTAGKRPARLDSESPPLSPNIFSINDKKINIRCKKYKEQLHSNKKYKLKYENAADQLNNLIKMELKSGKKMEITNDSPKTLKILPLSPDSLFSTHTESDLSPLSKVSPNGNNLFNTFTRSNLVSSHINSVQTLSPSWSCTSESTTPSAKSDYGHSQPIKSNSSVSLNISDPHDSKTFIDSEVKQIQRMPPPRQTLTLAAMREKMRAKKLAKEDSRKSTNLNNRKSSNFSANQRHKKQNLNILLKEEEDDFKLMEKMISNSDDLLNNSQESLLEFFMGNNYEFDTAVEQCVNINSVNYKSNLQKKGNLKSIACIKEKIKIPVSLGYSENNFDENNIHVKKTSPIESKLQCDKTVNSVSEGSLLNNHFNKESPPVENSFNDAISYVLQKLNLSKDNNGVLSHTTSGKSSLPNAYLVDSNGLTTALSIIQSLNPGAKVTTQQFYLVNSGPQLILQPNPPLAVPAEKVLPNSTQVGFQTKVSLAPKITNPISVNQFTNVLRDHPLPNSNSFIGVPINKISYNQTKVEKSVIQNSEINAECRPTTLSKVPISEGKNTFMVSSLSPNMSGNQPRSIHLQTISTPQPIGFVQPVQQSLPSLFPSQLRFMQPSLSNSVTSNTISFLTSNNATCNPSLVTTNQPPKLLFLCPTVPNNSNLVSASNVLNQDQKYLLLSKQPDKQATIQLVSSQGLWQQLNPNIISQPNNVLLMQSQPINTMYESLLCPNTYVPAISPITSDYSLNDRKIPCSNDIQMPNTSVFKEHLNKQPITSFESTPSPLIIDSKSLSSSNTKIDSSFEINNAKAKFPTIESTMTSLSNHTGQSVNSNAFSFFQSMQSAANIINDSKVGTDENSSALLTDKFKSPDVKSDQLDMLQSSQDVNLC